MKSNNEEASVNDLKNDIQKLREELKIIIELQKIFLQILKQIIANYHANLDINLTENLKSFLELNKNGDKRLKSLFQEVQNFLNEITILQHLEYEQIPLEKEVDKWRIISSTERLIEKFSPSHDTLIPNLLLETIKIIHQCEIPEKWREKIVKKLSLEIRSLIQEMFTKDPYMGLLKKIKDGQIKLSEKELKSVEKIVEERIKTLINLLENANKSWKDSILSAQFSLEAFNWGTAKTEKRFLQLFYQKAKKLIESVGEESKFENKILNSEVAILICELADQIIKIPKTRMKIEEMKRKI